MKERRAPALGKGMDSLLGLQSAGDVDVSGVMKISIQNIEPNPHQPRKIFHDEPLKSLALSIKEDGVIQPIIVSRGTTPGQYYLVAGERRWRASKMAGLTEIPAVIKDVSPEAMLRIALIENIQRSDLTVIEEAEAYRSLIEDFGLSQEQCANRVGKDRSTIANLLRLLSLPRQIQDDLLDRRISMGHGRAILALENDSEMAKARDIVVKKNLSVRQTEQLCKKFKESGTTDTKASDPDLEYLATQLRGHLRTKIRISGTAAKGKIEISYFNASELERLFSMMGLNP